MWIFVCWVNDSTTAEFQPQRKFLSDIQPLKILRREQWSGEISFSLKARRLKASFIPRRLLYQERSLGTSLCTTALVLADPSTTRGGEEVELRMDSTVLLSDSMDTFSSANLSNTPCIS